jgi:hypothetical protein
VISPEGSVKEFRYNVSGEISSELIYLSTYSGDISGVYESVVQQWAASLNLLNAIQRKDYSYDLRGQLTSETFWNTTASDGSGWMTACKPSIALSMTPMAN